MSEDTELLREIRDLLLLLAEPALAERDKKNRELLLQVVGKSKLRAAAAILMDGTRSQADIGNSCGFDKGNLSRFVKSLREAMLIDSNVDQPKITFQVPANFFDSVNSENA